MWTSPEGVSAFAFVKKRKYGYFPRGLLNKVKGALITDRHTVCADARETGMGNRDTEAMPLAKGHPESKASSVPRLGQSAIPPPSREGCSKRERGQT